MGEVFLAVLEGDDFRSTVALKVIRRGLDTDDVLARFKLERRILADLNHPNIARLLDGGATADGRPYLVMEYVEGVRIDEHCDRGGLGIRDRLGLFRTVCAAAQHAHSNLVVHRDIKPGNILVDGSGAPKLLDFGIGKIIGAEGERDGLTRTGVQVMTPEYAAPEQLIGGRVTTATDVYALGVVLYELLAGRHPHRGPFATLPDLVRAIVEAAPRLPSQALRIPEEEGGANEDRPTLDEIGRRRGTDPARLARVLSGDLDNIVAKALARDPERRYVSAAAFSDDLGRYLEGLPVLARPESVPYRVSKFVRRNRGGVAAAVLTTMLLIGSWITTQVQNRRIRAESARVVRERDKAQEVQGFLQEMFGAVGPRRTADDAVSARELLNAQAASIDQRYGSDPEMRAAMQYAVADAYQRLGLYDEAEGLARASLETRREVWGASHADIGHSLNLLGWIQHERRELEEAEELLRAAVTMWRELGGEHRGPLSKALNDLAITIQSRGYAADALVLLREALEIRLAEYGEGHRAVGITANNIAVAEYARGDLDAAEDSWRLSIRSLSQVLGPDHRRVWTARANLAAGLLAGGELAAAEAELRAVAAYWSSSTGEGSEETAYALTQLGAALLRRAASDASRYPEADSVVRRALEVRSALHGPVSHEVALSRNQLGTLLAQQGRLQESLEQRRRVIEIFRQVHGPEHPQVALGLRSLGETTASAGEPRRADSLHRAALALLEKAFGEAHPQTVLQLGIVGRGLVGEGRPEEAIPFLDRALAGAETALLPENTLFVDLRITLAEAHAEMGHRETVDSLLLVIDSGPPAAPAESTRIARLRVDAVGGG